MLLPVELKSKLTEVLRIHRSDLGLKMTNGRFGWLLRPLLLKLAGITGGGSGRGRWLEQRGPAWHLGAVRKVVVLVASVTKLLVVLVASVR